MDNQASSEIVPPRQAIAPRAINHVVFNVRDMEESHRFWTEIIGFKHVGTIKPRPDRPNPPPFRFYSCDHGDGKLSHHDLALVENKAIPAPPAEWSMLASPLAVNHVAILLPSREAWLKQLAFLRSKGVPFLRRVEHGMTHSLYITDPNGYGIELLYELPRDVWENDIDAALNYSVSLPTEGPEALDDRTEGLPVFTRET
jgi:catechol 2,3-dioxygenase